MKKSLLAALSLTALMSSASAADLPTSKAPVIEPLQAPMWRGFHVGLNAGGTWNNSNSIQVSTWPVSSIAAPSPVFWSPLNGSISSGSNAGFIGGGQIGYDWQVPFRGAAFVTGVEADIMGIASGGGSHSRNSIYPGVGGSEASPYTQDTIWNNVNGSANLQYLGTVRGRLGYLVTPSLLVYGTGGLAYGGVSINLNQTQIWNVGYGVSPDPVTPIGGFSSFGNTNYSNTQVGYTAGGGLEWMFLSNWSLKAEYLYYNLGNISVTSVMTTIPVGLFATPFSPQLWTSSTANTTISGNIVRAGLNYHLDFGAAPVVAKY